jgi:hypothetical protein
VDDLRWLKTSLNQEWVKYTILLLSSPLWWPFVKALWRAVNDALRDEGGIFGHERTAAELDALDRELGAHVSPLVSVTWEEAESGVESRPQPHSPRRGPPPPASRPRGFRPSR